MPDTEVRNLLYRHPEYYELVYPEPDEATPRMCSRMLERFLPLPPRSILDVGCGTGRDLDVLSRTCPDCWGVDLLPVMIEYAGRMHPHLTLQVGDMRSLRLGRTFDAIMCMGSAFMYTLTNEDVDHTLAAFAAHAHPGTVVILDINNAACYLGGGFRPRSRPSSTCPADGATGGRKQVRPPHAAASCAGVLGPRRRWAGGGLLPLPPPLPCRTGASARRPRLRVVRDV